jgi:hypothetical protein
MLDEIVWVRGPRTRPAVLPGEEAMMRGTTTTRMLVTGAAVVTALAGFTAAAAPADAAANWNIPKNIRYPFYPECDTHMSPYQKGYGTMTCKGEYTVNSSNYKFTEDNTHACPVRGKLQRITLDYVLNPAEGGVTTTKVLAGFSMHW